MSERRAGESKNDRRTATGAAAVRSCVVLLNPGSGTLLNNDELHGGLVEKFRARGIDARVHVCSDPAELSARTDDALADRAEAVVAGGGDGTVSAVAGRLLNRETSLGVLPLGTLNNFARDLGVPLDLDGALDVIAAGRIATVDAAQVNDHVFINNSSIGIYPTLVRLREARQSRGERKWRAFIRAMFTALRLYPLMRVRLTIDGREMVRRTPLLFVGNNEYQLEGIRMARRPRLDTGALGIAVTRDVGRLGLFALLARAIVRRAKEAEALDVFTAVELVVESRHKRIRVSADGEIHVERTPLRYRIRPGALRVIAPAAERNQSDSERTS